MLDVHLSGRRLSAFVDAELLPEDADRWREHLLRCSACTHAVAAERTVRERVRHSCVPQPSHAFVLRVVALAGEPDPQCPAAQPPGRSRRLVAARRSGVAMVVVSTTTAAAVVVIGLAAFGPLAMPDPESTPVGTPVAEASAGPASPTRMSPVFVRAGFGTMITYSLSPYGEARPGGR